MNIRFSLIVVTGMMFGLSACGPKKTTQPKVTRPTRAEKEITPTKEIVPQDFYNEYDDELENSSMQSIQEEQSSPTIPQSELELSDDVFGIEIQELDLALARRITEQSVTVPTTSSRYVAKV